MGERGVRVFIPLDRMDDVAVSRDEALVRKDSGLLGRLFDHIRSQCDKAVEVAGQDHQLNAPSDLLLCHLRACARLHAGHFRSNRGGRSGELDGVFGAVILSAAAGASFVVQQAVNASLRASIGSAGWADFVSYLGGTVCMVLLALVLRESVPAAAEVHSSHWWAWTGGFFGAVYIAISIFLCLGLARR